MPPVTAQAALFQLQVPGSSAWWVEVTGVDQYDAIAKTTTPLTNADVTAWASVSDWSGNLLMDFAQMSYVEPGHWAYEVPATVALDGAGPWLATIELHGNGGITDTKYRSFYAEARENNSR